MKIYNEIYQDNIHNYFHLEKKINRVYHDLQDLYCRHESKNRYTRASYDYDTGTLYTDSYNLESESADFVEAEQLIKKRIQRLEQRKELFEQLFNDLNPREKHYLRTKYKQGKPIKADSDIEQTAISIVDKMEELRISISPIKISSTDQEAFWEEQQQSRLKQANNFHEQEAEWLEA